jgi:predicted cation transporter
LAHFGAIGLLVVGAHYPVIVMGVFMMFLGLTFATKKYQGSLQIKEGMLVGYFLAGLVVLGGGQGWWVSPILQSMGSNALFWVATALTAITDNAALAYLATLVPDLSTASKYSVIAGAVTGGGLTVIANAPNPAGYGILSGKFGESGIKPQYLFLGALIPTLVTATLFVLFINLWPH